jgi:hypothetical protein
MLKSSSALLMLTLLTALVLAQPATSPKFLDHAAIQHSGPVATVTANHPVPLFQAVSGIREEYGWQIDWEAAPTYSHFDVVDDTGPRWRAAHPDAKGVTRPAGGLFISTFPEPTDTSAATKALVLTKVIQDYNATDNPGKYVLRSVADGQFTVVGIEVRDDTGTLREAHPILDTPVTIEKKTRSVYEAVWAILGALSVAAGKNVIIMSAPNNEFSNTQVTMGGRNIEARQLLREALDSTHRPLLYTLGFDPDYKSGTYILNVLVAAKAEGDEVGGRRLIPIDRRH